MLSLASPALAPYLVERLESIFPVRRHDYRSEKKRSNTMVTWKMLYKWNWSSLKDCSRHIIFCVFIRQETWPDSYLRQWRVIFPHCWCHSLPLTRVNEPLVTQSKRWPTVVLSPSSLYDLTVTKCWYSNNCYLSFEKWCFVYSFSGFDNINCWLFGLRTM